MDLVALARASSGGLNSNDSILSLGGLTELLACESDLGDLPEQEVPHLPQPTGGLCEADAGREQSTEAH